MVESVGFEPTEHISTFDGLANRSLRPLGQLSVFLLILVFGGRLAESNSNRVSDPSVFKTVPGPAQLTFRYLVEAAGLEPTMPRAGDLQSPGVTNFPTPP